MRNTRAVPLPLLLPLQLFNSAERSKARRSSGDGNSFGGGRGAGGRWRAEGRVPSKQRDPVGGWLKVVNPGYLKRHQPTLKDGVSCCKRTVMYTI